MNDWTFVSDLSIDDNSIQARASTMDTVSPAVGQEYMRYKIFFAILVQNMLG